MDTGIEERIGWHDHALHVAFLLLVLWALLGCGSVPLELCMDHPRYGQVCVTVVGGRVVKVVANVERLEADEDLVSWAQERVK